MNGATWVRVSGVLIPTAGLLPLRPEKKKLQVAGLRTRYCPWSRVLLCTTLAYWQLTCLCLSIGGVRALTHFACDRRSCSGDSKSHDWRFPGHSDALVSCIHLQGRRREGHHRQGRERTRGSDPPAPPHATPRRDAQARPQRSNFVQKLQ